MKANQIRRALISSILALLLCCSMLVGTTFAWFTDTVESGKNTIVAGNLDIELYYQLEGQSGWTKVDADTNVFKQGTLWEPGHTEVVKLKVVNEGNLALKYILSVNIASESGSVNVYGREFLLSKHIKYGIVDGAQNYTREQAINAVDSSAKLLNVGYHTDGVTLLPKTVDNTDNEDILTMVVYMPTTEDNEANHKFGYPAPVINLGIKLFATQYPYEEDSFDETYDIITTIANYDQYIERKGEDGSYLVIEDFTADDYIFWGNAVEAVLDMNGKTIDADNKDQFFFIAQGGGTLRLYGNGTVNMGQGFYSSNPASNIIVEDGTYTMTATDSTKATGPYHSIVQKEASITVNGGTFISNVENAAFFYVTNGTVLINGGFFENTVDDTPDMFDVGHNAYTRSRIEIRGGTFVNYNPMKDNEYMPSSSLPYETYTGPCVIVVPGYTVVSETQANGDTWYTVVPE